MNWVENNTERGNIARQSNLPTSFNNFNKKLTGDVFQDQCIDDKVGLVMFNYIVYYIITLFYSRSI